jgi:hypothetical protein
VVDGSGFELSQVPFLTSIVHIPNVGFDVLWCGSGRLHTNKTNIRTNILLKANTPTSFYTVS